MSLSQFHCTSRLYLDMHGLIFETSICYWQDQPGRYSRFPAARPRVRRRPRGCTQRSRCRRRPRRAGARRGGGLVPAARAGRSAEAPRRTRVEGMLPKGFLGPVSSETGRSPECATRSEGSRKRVSGRSLRRQAARRRRVPVEGGQRRSPPGAARGRTAGTDGASRSRSAGVGRGGVPGDRSPGTCSSAPGSGPQAASSVRRACCRRGPCKRRATSSVRSVDNGVRSSTGEEAPRSHDGPCWVRAVGRAIALHPRLAPGSQIRAGKSLPSLRERISQEGARDGPR